MLVMTRLVLTVAVSIILVHQVLLRTVKRFVHHPATGLYDPHSPSR